MSISWRLTVLYFEIDLTTRTVETQPAYAYAKTQAALTSDRGLTWDDPGQKLQINYSLGGVVNNTPLLKFLRDAGIPISGTGNEQFIATYGTDPYKKSLANYGFLGQAREGLRGVAPQDPPVTGDDVFQKGASAATDDILNTQKGICLGRGHEEKDSHLLILDTVKNKKVDMLFLEEFTVEEQQDIDDFVKKRSPTIPDKLQKRCAMLKDQFGVDWEEVLTEARNNDVEIYAVDSAEARDYADQQGAETFGERRVAMMNSVTHDVMDRVIKNNPTKKYMAVVGADHSNTYQGGITGVSQMFGITAVRVGKNGKLARHVEDRSLRGMPSRDEQMFIDNYVTESDKRGLVKPAPEERTRRAEKKKQQAAARGESTDPIALMRQVQLDASLEFRKKAETRARQLKDIGALPSFGEEVFVEAYMKRAQKELNDPSLDVRKLRAAAEDERDHLKEQLKTELQKLDDEVGPELVKHATLIPKPDNADQLTNLHAEAVQHGKKGTLEELQQGVKKLKYVQETLNGGTPTLEAEVDMSQVLAGVPTSAIKQTAKDVKERDERFQLAAAAVQSGDVGELTRLLTSDPKLLRATNDKGQNLLHLAAGKENALLLQTVLDNSAGVSLDLPDAEGNAPLHLCCKERRSGKQNDAQSDSLKLLIERGANVNCKNGNGSTALHLVALTNNDKALQTLFDKKADPAIKDARGWSALDTAIGATSLEVEKLFYSSKKATASPVGDSTNKMSAVDLLCQVTLCEDPADKAKVRQAYENMYANTTLRPIVELAALNSTQERDPPSGGSRIFIAKGDSTKNLFLWPQGQQQQYPQGAYDEEANVVMFSADSANDFTGVIAHELTHMTTHVVNGGRVVPFAEGDDKTKKEYVAAIESDVKGMHLLPASSPQEKWIRERICGRMGEYAGRKLEEGLLEEFIVGVPQLIAQFGDAAVERYAPELYKFFKSYTVKCHDVGQSDKFRDARDKIDNTSLAGLKERTYDVPKEKDDWLAPNDKTLSVDELLGTIALDYKVKHGAPDRMTGVNIAFQPESYKLTPDQEKELTKKLAKVKKALATSLNGQLLTLSVSTEDYRKLIETTSKLVHDTKEKDLEDKLTKAANGWLVDSKSNCLTYKTNVGANLTEVEMAEGIVLTAEMQSTRASDYTVDIKKHAQLVAGLKESLGKLSADKKDTPDKQNSVIGQLVAKISGDKDAGVHVKSGFKLIGEYDSSHVSINVKNARRRWVELLKTL